MTQTPASEPTPTPGATAPAGATSPSSASPSPTSTAGSTSKTPPTQSGGTPAKGAPVAPKSAKQRKAEEKAHDPLRGSRSSGFYASVVALAVVLVLLIIFILQNTQTAEVHFLGWTGSAPASVVLLIAAAAGLFLALVASSLRIFQLRRRVKRDRKAA